jgi:hypothetical protein
VTTDEQHAALRRLHRFFEGVLAIDERFERTNFVLDPATRRPVFPAPPGALEATDLTLHIPEDEPGALHLLGKPVELDPNRDEACDRYLFYFGKPRWSRFAAITIDHIKTVDLVIDGDEAMIENPLRRIEPTLCRLANRDPQAVATLCQRRANVNPSNPKLVGIDPYGLDIRAEFGPIRIELDAIVSSEDQAKQTLEALLTI